MADPELAYPGNPFGLGVRAKGDMASVYLTDEDTQLRIVCCNTAAGVTIGLQGLRIDENGVSQPIVETFTPPSDGSVATRNFPVGKGTLLRLTAFAAAGLPVWGATYAYLQLVRGLGASLRVLATLAGDYLTVNQSIGFPGSPIRRPIDGPGMVNTYAVTNPAAGADWLIAVPANKRWEVLSVMETLTTSAVVGNRFARLQLPFNSAAHTVLPWTAAVASQVRRFNWGLGLTTRDPFTLLDGSIVVQQPLPAGVRGAQLASIASSTDNMAAGDQWSNIQVMVREWLDF